MKYITVVMFALLTAFQAQASTPDDAVGKSICVRVFGKEVICIDVSSELKFDTQNGVQGLGQIDRRTSQFLIDPWPIHLKSGEIKVLKATRHEIKSKNLIFTLVPGAYQLRDGQIALKIDIEG